MSVNIISTGNIFYTRRWALTLYRGHKIPVRIIRSVYSIPDNEFKNISTAIIAVRRNTETTINNYTIGRGGWSLRKELYLLRSYLTINKFDYLLDRWRGSRVFNVGKHTRPILSLVLLLSVVGFVVPLVSVQTRGVRPWRGVRNVRISRPACRILPREKTRADDVFPFSVARRK